MMRESAAELSLPYSLAKYSLLNSQFVLIIYRHCVSVVLLESEVLFSAGGQRTSAEIPYTQIEVCQIVHEHRPM